MNEIDEIVVTGGRPLHGTVRIQGSKNTALPVMAAALLSSGTSVLRECPKITDVFLMEKILRELGAETWWEDHDLYLDCSHADGTVIPEYFSGKMRSSVILRGQCLDGMGKHGPVIRADVSLANVRWIFIYRFYRSLVPESWKTGMRFRQPVEN